MVEISLTKDDQLSDEDAKDSPVPQGTGESPGEIDPHDPEQVAAEMLRVSRVEDEKLYRPAARKTYAAIRDQLFKTFQHITSTEYCTIPDYCDTPVWQSTPIPADRLEQETLQLYTARKGLEGTGFCYWRVCGTLQLQGDHLDLLLSDYWPRTRLSWDGQEMEDVRVVERFPECHIMVVQTLRKDAPKNVKAAGGTLGIHYHRYNVKRRTWVVLFHSIRQHRHVHPGPPTTCRGMGETWTAAFIRENTQDAALCSVDIVTKVWDPVATEQKILGSLRARPEEKLRQRMHLYERVELDWFRHFPPDLRYGSDPPDDPDAPMGASGSPIELPVLPPLGGSTGTNDAKIAMGQTDAVADK